MSNLNQNLRFWAQTSAGFENMATLRHSHWNWLFVWLVFVWGNINKLRHTTTGEEWSVAQVKKDLLGCDVCATCNVTYKWSCNTSLTHEGTTFGHLWAIFFLFFDILKEISKSFVVCKNLANLYRLGWGHKLVIAFKFHFLAFKC